MSLFFKLTAPEEEHEGWKLRFRAAIRHALHEFIRRLRLRSSRPMDCAGSEMKKLNSQSSPASQR